MQKLLPYYHRSPPRWLPHVCLLFFGLQYILLELIQYDLIILIFLLKKFGHVKSMFFSGGCHFCTSVTFARRDTFARRHFCTSRHFWTATFFRGDNFLRQHCCTTILMHNVTFLRWNFCTATFWHDDFFARNNSLQHSIHWKMTQY